MNVNFYVFAVGAVIGFAAFAASQNQETGVPLKSRHEQGAMSQRSDADLSKALQRQLSLLGSGQESRPLIRKLRAELARRGDREERERIFAALRSSDLAEQAQALEDAAYVGDQEAVYYLAEMLDDPNPGDHLSMITPEGKAIVTDVIVMAPRLVAAMKLAELIESPPVPPIGGEKKFYTEKDVQIWQRWWQANKDKFEAFR